MRHRLSPAAIGRWSAGHPRRAIVAWLAFVTLAVAALALTGSKQLDNGAAGESARADATLNEHQVGLSQHEYGYLHDATLRATTPEFRTAIDAVAARMRRALGSPVTTEISDDRHSALVSGEIDRPFSTGALEASLAAVAASHPGLATVLSGEQ